MWHAVGLAFAPNQLEGNSGKAEVAPELPTEVALVSAVGLVRIVGHQHKSRGRHLNLASEIDFGGASAFRRGWMLGHHHFKNSIQIRGLHTAIVLLVNLQHLLKNLPDIYRCWYKL